MSEVYYFEEAYIGYAIGTAATYGIGTNQYNNAAALTTDQTKAFDARTVQNLSITPSRPGTEKVKMMGTGNLHEKETLETIWMPGKFSFDVPARTGILLYPACHTCSTTDGTPNIHAVTPAVAGSNVVRFAFHVEAESSTTPYRRDLLGAYITLLELKNADQQASMYHVEGEFLIDVPGSDLAQDTKLTDRTFSFADCTVGGWTFTYDSNAVDGEVLGATFRVENTYGMGGCASATIDSVTKVFYKECYLTEQNFSFDVTFKPKGDNGAAQNLYTIARTPLSSYAGALAFGMYMARNASNDYIDIALDETELQPFPIDISPSDVFTHDITLISSRRGSNSPSPAIEIKDAYDTKYYEND
jgi:hypothetical protein